jgi:N-acetylglucosamine malate deacetylase 1
MSYFADQAGPTLVIAPHPDDEVLGCGGTIALLADQGVDVQVAVVTQGQAPRFAPSQVATVRAEAEAAHALLGVCRSHWLDFPAAGLDQVSHTALNDALAGVIAEVAPETIFLPFAGDIHLDHKLIFQSAMVAMRPRAPLYPRRVLAYETVSETNWSTPSLSPPFHPNVTVDISATLNRKLAAFACYVSQQSTFPNERSAQALEALAAVRGATVHRVAGEAFLLIREVG